MFAMVRLSLLLLVANLALLVFALIDCLSADPRTVRALPKYAWALIILFFSPIGAIAYLALGRPLAAATDGDESGPAPADGTRGYRRPPAPDDDPDFLRDLAARNRKLAAGGKPDEPGRRAPDPHRPTGDEPPRAGQHDDDFRPGPSDDDSS